MATAAQQQQLVLFKLGLAIPGGPSQDAETSALMAAAATVIEAVWENAASLSTIPGLTSLYAYRDTLDLLLGQYRTRIDSNLGPLNIREGQLFRNLLDLRKNVMDEVVRLEKRAAANIPPAIGPILATAPQQIGTSTVTIDDSTGARIATVDVSRDRPDPNDPAWGGSPIRKPGQPFPPR